MMLDRRSFLAAASAVAVPLPAATLPIRKAVYIGMLPEKKSYLERFRIAREAGFEEIECATVEDPREAEEIAKAAADAKLRIHSVMNAAHWQYPLSSADPEVVKKSVAGVETSIRNAALWKADTVLLVPAVVDAKTSYADAWTRSQKVIRGILPSAAKHKVIIGIENVWNKFLLSPLEMARYVDEFRSEWVRAYFDVGNVVLYGYPQDWIRTLGKRIVKLHLKDFRFPQRRTAEWVNLKEGEIDWKAIHAALTEIGYKGTATVELADGDLEYLRDVARRVDSILSAA